MGTLTYMSPEQVKDSKHIDLRSDIYSLGVTLYYMLSGKKAYDTSTLSDYDLRKAIVELPFPKLQKNTELQPIIDKATAKKPADRFQTCKEFAEALADNSNQIGFQNLSGLNTKPTDSVVSSHTDSNNDDKTEIYPEKTVSEAPSHTNDETIIASEDNEKNDAVIEPIKKKPKASKRNNIIAIAFIVSLFALQIGISSYLTNSYFNHPKEFYSSFFRLFEILTTMALINIVVVGYQF